MPDAVAGRLARGRTVCGQLGWAAACLQAIPASRPADTTALPALLPAGQGIGKLVCDARAVSGHDPIVLPYFHRWGCAHRARTRARLPWCHAAPAPHVCLQSHAILSPGMREPGHVPPRLTAMCQHVAVPLQWHGACDALPPGGAAHRPRGDCRGGRAPGPQCHHLQVRSAAAADCGDLISAQPGSQVRRQHICSPAQRRRQQSVCRGSLPPPSPGLPPRWPQVQPGGRGSARGVARHRSRAA